MASSRFVFPAPFSPVKTTVPGNEIKLQARIIAEISKRNLLISRTGAGTAVGVISGTLRAA